MTWSGISLPTRISLVVTLNPSVICGTAQWRRSTSLKRCVSRASAQSFFLPREPYMGICAGTNRFPSLRVLYCLFPHMVLARLEVRHLYRLFVMSMVYGH